MPKFSTTHGFGRRKKGVKPRGIRAKHTKEVDQDAIDIEVEQVNYEPQT